MVLCVHIAGVLDLVRRTPALTRQGEQHAPLRELPQCPHPRRADAALDGTDDGAALVLAVLHAVAAEAELRHREPRRAQRRRREACSRKNLGEMPRILSNISRNFTYF